MKVAVTGAAGFLGRHLVRLLVARGDTPVAIDLAFVPPLGPGIPCHRASVTDRAAMERALAGADAVIHAAAITGLWARDAGLFERVNAGGTATVLEAAEATGLSRAVYVSSFVTLIAGPRSRVIQEVDETLELPPEAMLGPYPRSKRLGELISKNAGLPTVIVQPTAPIGPGDHAPTPPMKLLTDLANGKLPAMIDCTWNLIDIRALAEGVLAALDRGRPGRRYLLSGENLTTDRFLSRFAEVSGISGPKARVPYGVAYTAAWIEERIAGLTGRPPNAPLTGLRLAGPARRFSNARAAEELGFAPPPIDAALGDGLLWLREQGRLTKPLPGFGE